MSFVMPGRIYEYITTAAGLLLLYNWFFILVTAGKLLEAQRVRPGQTLDGHGAYRACGGRYAIS